MFVKAKKNYYLNEHLNCNKKPSYIERRGGSQGERAIGDDSHQH